MKIQIKNIFQSSRIYTHSRYYDIVIEAREKGIIDSQAVKYLSYYDHCLLSGRRIKESLFQNVKDTISKLDRAYPDLTQIKNKIAAKIAQEFCVEHYLDVGIANVKILKTRVKAQIYLDKWKEWRDITITN
jgi:hypothetical protein